MKTDREGNIIGNGNWHTLYNVEVFDGFPQITSKVEKSETTESVYVKYYNSDNGKSVIVRFSNHNCNAERFGDVLGRWASKDEILYNLGLKKRRFEQSVRIFIPTQQVKKKKLAAGEYEYSEYTIQELYNMVKNKQSIKSHIGKVAKNSNYLILDDGKEFLETRVNCFGEEVKIGKYIYFD